MMAIYMIRNKVNGKFYVGSTKNFTQRKSGHLLGLRKNENRSRKLQRAWNKHGEENFVFEILEEVFKIEDLIPREQFYLDSLNPAYNIRKKAESSLGIKYEGDEFAERYGKMALPVLQYDLNMNFICEWPSARKAAEAVKANTGNITKCCKGYSYFCKGFKWRFKDKPYESHMPHVDLTVGKEFIISDGESTFKIRNLLEYCKTHEILNFNTIDSYFRSRKTDILQFGKYTVERVAKKFQNA